MKTVFLMITAGLLLIAGNGRAESNCDVQTLLAPLEKNQFFIEGHRVDGVYGIDGTVRVQLREESTETVWTLFLEEDRGRDAPGRAGGIVVLYSQEAAGCDGQEEAVAEAVLRIERFVETNTSSPLECLRVSAEMVPSEIVAPIDRGDPVSLSGTREWIPLAVTWICILILLVFGGLFCWKHRKHKEEFRRKWAFGLLGLGLLALTLSWFLVGEGPIHTNHHGIHEIELLLNGLEGPSQQFKGPLNGEVTRAVLYPLTVLLGATTSLVFGWGLFQLVFFPGLLAMVTRRWAIAHRVESADLIGLIAGVMAATWPVALRLGPTESPQIFAVNCVLMAMLAVEYLSRKPGWRIAVIAGCLVIICMRLRVQPFFWVCGLGLWSTTWNWERRSWRWVAGVYVVAIAFSLDHLLASYQTFVHTEVSGLGGDALGAVVLSSDNLIFDGSWTSSLIPLSAVVGVGVFWRHLRLTSPLRARVSLVGYLFVFLALSLLALQLSGYMSARIRYQVILGVVWFPMAALGLVGLMTWLQQRSRAAMPVVALVSLVSVLPGLELLRHPDMEVQQWDAFKGMIDGLPDQAIVVVPPAGKRTREGFPVALARDNGKSILIVPATSEGKVPPLVMNTNRSVYYLRSISCGLNPSIGPPCEERVKNRELIREYVLEDKIRRESSFYRFPYRDPSRVALYKLY